MFQKMLIKVRDKSVQSEQEPQSFVEKLHRLRRDIPPSEIKELILDSEKYYLDNPDVKESGMCAVGHFFDYGEKEGRTFHIPQLRHKKTYTAEKNHKKIIYSTLPANSGTNLYRAIFPGENDKNCIFNHAGSTLEETLESIFTADEVIFIRPNYDPLTVFLMTLCRKTGVTVTLDIDDLMLPEFVASQGAVRSNDIDAGWLEKILIGDSSLLLLADKIVCSTPLLVEIYKKSHSNVSLRRNKLPKRFFSENQKNKKEKNGPLKILYLSGTKTHVMDFSIISGVMMRLAQTRDDFEMTFLGKTGNYANTLKAAGASVQQIDIVSFAEMMTIISHHDVVLVPLEDTVFNNAKSNIKFIEAAACGVPIIASPVSEFSQFIKHGVNGWICHSTDEWYNCIASLAHDRDAAINAGLAAHHTSLTELSL